MPISVPSTVSCVGAAEIFEWLELGIGSRKEPSVNNSTHEPKSRPSSPRNPPFVEQIYISFTLRLAQRELNLLQMRRGKI
jgi:hypothetical protein